jgi:hypothetical protein
MEGCVQGQGRIGEYLVVAHSCEGSWDVSIERPRGAAVECSELYLSLSSRHMAVKWGSIKLRGSGQRF